MPKGSLSRRLRHGSTTRFRQLRQSRLQKAREASRAFLLMSSQHSASFQETVIVPIPPPDFSYSPIFNRHVFSIDMVDIASDILVAASGNSVWILGTNCKTLSIKFRCPVVILRPGGRFRGYAGRNGVAVRHVQAAIALSGGGHLFLEPILLDGPLPRLTLLLAVPGILKYPLRQGGKRQLSS